MEQICLEELTTRVLELERVIRSLLLDAETARASRMAQLQDVQQLQAAAAAADARAAAADERADSERIKTREALSQCKVKQQQHRQLLLSFGRDLRQLIVDQ